MHFKNRSILGFWTKEKIMRKPQNFQWKEMTMGTCYYPEHWSRELWQDDLQRMKAAGITVIRVAEFAWNKVEPEEDVFVFDFWDEFLELCTQTLTIKNRNKIFTNYIIADCCSKYGKTKHLLDFIKWFDLLYGKDKLTVKQAETKFDSIKSIIDKYSELSATGKTFIIDSKKILIELFDNIPDEDLYLPEILEMQIKLFENLRYVNSELNENYYYVLNTRNEIKPNLIIYQLSTGNILNVKVDKQMFDILFIQDGDIIQVNKSEYRYGVKIIGKDEDGVNITDTDYNKQYLYLLGYDILYRDYSKSNKSLVEE